MKKKIRKVLVVILSLVFLGSLTMLLFQWKDYRAGEEIYAQAEQAAKQPPSEAKPAPEEPQPQENPDETEVILQEVSVAALQEISSAVVGWIHIPETMLSYPLVQGEDNSYYLDHAWNGQVTSVGSIFMDCRCAPDFTDFNTIVYGHRMRNGSMFASLKYYNKLTYWEEHPLVYIKDGEMLRRYEIFAAYETPVRACTYETGVTDEASRQAVIDFAVEHSVIDTGIVPEVTDRIVTLSTCTGDGYDTRWVVQAVERPAS